jgi:hypothetical protein
MLFISISKNSEDLTKTVFALKSKDKKYDKLIVYLPVYSYYQTVILILYLYKKMYSYKYNPITFKN